MQQQILENFKGFNYKVLSSDAKKSLITQTIDSICTDVQIPNCMVSFKDLNDNKLSFYDKNLQCIYISNDLLQRGVNQFDVLAMSIYETRHHEQNIKFMDTDTKMGRHLDFYISGPYELYNETERDAYEYTYEQMKSLQSFYRDKSFDDAYEKQIEKLKQKSNENKKSLNKRLYLNPEKEIEILGVYDKIDKEIAKNLKQTKPENFKVSAKNTQYAIKIKKGIKEWQAKIIDLKTNDNINISIDKNTCYITGYENLKEKEKNISHQVKKQLNQMLKHVISMYNKENKTQIEELDVVPISLTENKLQYEKYLKQIKDDKNFEKTSDINKYKIKYDLELDKEIEQQIKEEQQMINLEKYLEDIQEDRITEENLNIGKLNKMVNAISFEQDVVAKSFNSMGKDEIIYLLKNSFDVYDTSIHHSTSLKKMFSSDQLSKTIQTIQISSQLTSLNDLNLSDKISNYNEEYEQCTDEYYRKKQKEKKQEELEKDDWY